jgi:CRP-like cAMP-binding protein
MHEARPEAFSTDRYLATEGDGRRIVRLKAKQHFFLQGSTADSIYYIQSGRAKLTVVSKKGKEATVTLLAAKDFFGEECLAQPGRIRTSTASAIVACVALKISREQMLRVLHEEHVFSTHFLNFMLLRGIRTQADLIDQLFNSSERRLAGILLLRVRA